MNLPTIRAYLGKQPQVDDTVYIDPLALIIGDCHIAAESSIWPFAIARADVNCIHIGKRSNIQDHAMLHVSHKNADNPQGSPLVIGDDVTVGHHAVLHGCTVGNRVLVGIQTIILDNVVIEDDVLIGAGSLVPPSKVLQSGYLYVGSPVRQVRPLSDREKALLAYSAAHYVKVKNHYLLPEKHHDS